MTFKIPFNKPFIIGKELYYISQSVLSGKIAGDGLFTRKCNKLLEEYFSAKKVLLTHSCTAALEMAAILCNIKEGDEVILPSFTFVSTANAFFLRGAKLIFADIRQDTLNIDEQLVRDAVTEKTKIILPVHYAGVSCEMDDIMEVARKNGIYVVEDAAQGVSAKYKGKYLGTIGDIGAYSFHETKNFICGEGGAIVINNEKFIERAEIIREKGTNRSKFFRGEVDKYTWVDIGSSYLPSDILAAFLYAQIENLEKINKKRSVLFDFYYKELISLVNGGMIKLPYVPSSCSSNNHLFYIVLEDEKIRDNLMDHMKSKGILSVFHYLPLHLSPMGKSMGYNNGQLPVTEKMSSRLLRLPFYYELTTNEQEIVVNTIKEFFKS
jgi:dTDP-4-amino-4,6-dideoxygalactose transaminase